MNIPRQLSDILGNENTKAKVTLIFASMVVTLIIYWHIQLKTTNAKA